MLTILTLACVKKSGDHLSSLYFILTMFLNLRALFAERLLVFQ